MRTFSPSKRPTSNELWRSAGFPASRGPELILRLRQGLPVSVIETIHSWAGFPKADILRITGINAKTLSRRKASSGVLSPDESEKIARLIRVADAAVALFEGDREKAVNWMRKPVRGLANETPESLLNTESGAVEVLDLIGRLEHGVFS